MSFPNPQDTFIPSSQSQQPSQLLRDLPYIPHRVPASLPPDVNPHFMHRALPAGSRMQQVPQFSHPHMRPSAPPPPPSHVHSLHSSAPISYPQPGPPSQPPPPRYMFATAVPVVDSSHPHAQPTTTSRSVSASHVAANVPSYAPPSHAQYAHKIAYQHHIPYPQPPVIAPPASGPHVSLHSNVAQSRPFAPQSPVSTKLEQPHHRLPPQMAHAANVSARPLSQSSPAGQRFFVGTLTKDQFVENAARVLDYTASKNDDSFPLPLYSEPESVFFSVVKPEIPTKEYMKRLVTYTHCSPSAFIVMLVYLDRVARNNKKLVVTPYNMHRLLITALTLACKNLDDQCFANAHYAKVGGIPTVREMNRLELQFLKYLKYHLFVNREEHEAKIRQLSVEPNSPIAIHGQSFTPPPGPCKMGIDRKHNIATRAYGRVMAIRPKPDSGTEAIPLAYHHVSKRTDGAVAEVNCGPETYEKVTANEMPSIYHNGGVQCRSGGCSSATRRHNMGVEAMEVCRPSAPMEASFVTSTSATSRSRP